MEPRHRPRRGQDGRAQPRGPQRRLLLGLGPKASPPLPHAQRYILKEPHSAGVQAAPVAAGQDILSQAVVVRVYEASTDVLGNAER